MYDTITLQTYTSTISTQDHNISQNLLLKSSFLSDAIAGAIDKSDLSLDI